MIEQADATAPASAPGQWPAVTVITPTLGNRPDLLGQVLDAIRNQDYPGEIRSIVVLDVRSAEGGPAGGGAAGGSAAGDARGSDRWTQTRAVAAAAGASAVENQRHPGLAGSRNTGILAADTEFVAFCDDDDFWLPGKLASQVRALLDTPGAALACCGITIESSGNAIERVHPATSVTFTDLLRSRLTALHVSTFVARRAALLDGVGLVSEEIPGSRAEDYELLLRAARHAPVLNIPSPGVRVLWHTGRQQMYGRWPLVAQALPWLLDHYPEFGSEPAGYARIAGQVAFAAAACGDRRMTWTWARRAIRARAREPRSYLALAVASGLVKPGTIVTALRRRGHGI
ncbi:MAG TPA: glycosyltransferase family 2 protein [Streptosporangiaceae bacterium]|jgi:glycosyltransferase involved in cell wall biosynthesis